MGNFNRSSRPGGGRGFERRSFSDRDSRGPVQMHQTVCDSCGKSCEVPFRPTSGKPVFCSSCFENNRGSDSRGFDRRNSDRSSSFDDRQMFDATCDECRNSCKVPFRPTSGKPVYCSNCFGEKKGNGERSREQAPSQPQYNDKFEQLNNKLDKILLMLAPNAFEKPVAVVEEVIAQQPDEQTVESSEVTKPAKKKSSKKKNKF